MRPVALSQVGHEFPDRRALSRGDARIGVWKGARRLGALCRTIARRCAHISSVHWSEERRRKGHGRFCVARCGRRGARPACPVPCTPRSRCFCGHAARPCTDYRGVRQGPSVRGNRRHVSVRAASRRRHLVGRGAPARLAAPAQSVRTRPGHCHRGRSLPARHDGRRGPSVRPDAAAGGGRRRGAFGGGGAAPAGGGMGPSRGRPHRPCPRPVRFRRADGLLCRLDSRAAAALGARPRVLPAARGGSRRAAGGRPHGRPCASSRPSRRHDAPPRVGDLAAPSGVRRVRVHDRRDGP